jgi:superfamily II DNA helicase RecQ
MKNQIDAAKAVGIKAVNINSDNKEEWGHDFRTDYQRIVKLLSNFPASIT